MLVSNACLELSSRQVFTIAALAFIHGQVMAGVSIIEAIDNLFDYNTESVIYTTRDSMRQRYYAYQNERKNIKEICQVY